MLLETGAFVRSLQEASVLAANRLTSIDASAPNPDCRLKKEDSTYVGKHAQSLFCVKTFCCFSEILKTAR